MVSLFENRDTEKLKAFLNQKVEQFNTPDFLADDPLGVVHRFSNQKDIEVMGLFMAILAWGNRKSIINSGNKLVEIFENAPFQFISQHREEDFKNIKFIHRTFQTSDLQFISKGLQTIYSKQESLEFAFSTHDLYPEIKGRIVNFREAMLRVPHEQRSEKHLANPLKKSAAKRLNMFLRWMVRDNSTGVDFGIWKSIPTSELYVPLDVHTSKVARSLGLITRPQDDWLALEELMKNLRDFDANDPCKYDFALFGLGAMQK